MIVGSYPPALETKNAIASKNRSASDRCDKGRAKNRVKNFFISAEIAEKLSSSIDQLHCMVRRLVPDLL